MIPGPTASGKSDAALCICDLFTDAFEIVSVDSVQVYRELDIGSGKINASQRKSVPHHLIDVVNPDEHFDFVTYCALADKAVDDIQKRKKIPLFTGGTLLYLDTYFFGYSPMPDSDPLVRDMLLKKMKDLGINALHHELANTDPVSAAAIHPNDSQRILRALEVHYITGKKMSDLRGQKKGRIGEETIFISPKIDRETLYNRINERVNQMISSGFIDEVQKLIDKGYDKSLNSMNSIGYSQIYDYLKSKCDLNFAIEDIKKKTRKYAKKQITWLKRYDFIKYFDMTDRKGLSSFVNECFLLTDNH
ncbi:MAG TPA: tRNA (adenosine(37)-N6)-dimethylallyltransferase MiaA [Spirochaetota bacterium]|nr:tRNA (adenosine(37)-N6)-dimethylallyltransferase MiaA [Spirochaetota bacterium]